MALPMRGKRLDPEDGEVYTFEELRHRALNQDGFTDEEVGEYWDEVCVEMKVDPDDLKAYSFASMCEKYKASYTRAEIDEYWEGCQLLGPVDAAMESGCSRGAAANGAAGTGMANNGGASVLRTGVRAKLVGLRSRPEFNGQVAELLLHDENAGRWDVLVKGGASDGQRIRCRPRNLRIIPGGSPSCGSLPPEAATGKTATAAPALDAATQGASASPDREDGFQGSGAVLRDAHMPGGATEGGDSFLDGNNLPSTFTEVKDLGNKLFQAGNVEGARRCYLRALGCGDAGRDGRATIYGNLAQCYLRHGRGVEALAWCKRALAEDPVHVKNLYRKALALELQGNIAGAWRTLRQAGDVAAAMPGQSAETLRVRAEVTQKLAEVGAHADKIAPNGRAWRDGEEHKMRCREAETSADFENGFW